MDDQEWLAEQFEQSRTRLRAVAYRMLGSATEADDAVQESWLRASRAGVDGVDNLGGWLTTVVSRVCLDRLRSRRSRREQPLDGVLVDAPSGDRHPEDEAVLADALGAALLVVLDALTPAERLAFVLHDLFAVPFDEISEILDRSPAAVRQLASRARRRVQGADPDAAPNPADDRARQREVVDAFFAASRRGDFDTLLALLHPDVVLRADRASVEMGAEARAVGARAVAETFSGRAKGAKVALLGGDAGAVWQQGGQVRVAFAFTVADGAVLAIDQIADAAHLAELEPVVLS